MRRIERAIYLQGKIAFTNEGKKNRYQNLILIDNNVWQFVQ